MKTTKHRALISVYDKSGLLPLAAFLKDEGWEIISTGGTAKYLSDNKIVVTDISSITGFPECLDGRVKTLHPAIHAGLLAKRDKPEHMATLQELNIETIDLVCVNLYPFFEKAIESYEGKLNLDDTIEFIDIGGPSMLRSAAKNFKDVIVLSESGDYDSIMEALKGGKSPKDVDISQKRALAGKVFDLTSAYDAAIARYLLNTEDTSFPKYWPMSLEKKQNLRYGENGHQSAALYLSTGPLGCFASMQQLHGKELSYNNIRDLDLAWKAACAFGLPEAGVQPLGEDSVVKAGEAAGIKLESASNSLVCCAAIKHNTPCGLALGKTLNEAFVKAKACDPISIFGGIVACNTTVDADTAAKLHDIFLEIVAAPAFDDEALEILKKKKNLRIIKMTGAPVETHECISIDGGLLTQSADRTLLSKWEVVTKLAPPPELYKDMLFGMRAVTYAKSNAIVVVNNLAALGIGCGQTNRIWAAEQALERAAKNTIAEKYNTKPLVMASDAFFPFPDCVEAAAKAGIKAIIQPGGSVNDDQSIEACDKLGVAMVFTGARHFKH
ncbi:MAG: bifunctional phosphoribosylaminoimidazolecarboxamide formyltransferase/IMP cyclohydrolase [Spirochaetaceae bacterium]|jgi:phosphoribosylaminoimidazolecarboxamide formyltransferase/IMP cyclohydrolase|nr:bifunctional phosphoribosylaminoimidazolecarboxamide formyltransferase/IMP cyclohydrolase [Spirochaetaceae bacterium]